jgi:hypothetical protein
MIITRLGIIGKREIAEYFAEFLDLAMASQEED